MNTATKGLSTSVKERRVLVALLVTGMLFIVLLGQLQAHSLNSNPLPNTNKASEAQCLSDMRNLHVDVSGAKSVICLGK